MDCDISFIFCREAVFFWQHERSSFSHFFLLLPPSTSVKSLKAPYISADPSYVAVQLQFPPRPAASRPHTWNVTDLTVGPACVDVVWRVWSE